MHRAQLSVFHLYEQRNLRNWFYTLAFAVFVPVGYRFAGLAWEYGSWYDKPLALIAGLLIGIATAVTLLRIWHVPPKQVVTTPAPLPPVAPQNSHVADEVMATIRQRAALNRDLASHAAALGSSIHRTWH